MVVNSFFVLFFIDKWNCTFEKKINHHVFGVRYDNYVLITKNTENRRIIQVFFNPHMQTICFSYLCAYDLDEVGHNFEYLPRKLDTLK